MPTIHAFVLSWTGQDQNAGRIASQVRDAAEHVTVIHSGVDGQRFNDRPGWVQVPPGDFYGANFARSLALNQGDVMLHLHADAHAADWAAVVRQCRDAYLRVPDLGVWAPDVNYSPFPLEEVHIGPLGDHALVPVAQTDAIVWSVSAPVMARLRQLDLGLTPLGWGIDWAAICFCVSHGLLVLRDRSLAIEHPRGSGYGHDLAAAQMVQFLRQLSPAEQVVHALLAGHIEERRRLLGRATFGP